MSEGLIELTGANFVSETAKGITLVDFWAPWCGPCRMQTPILERLAPKVAGKARIAKVNVDEEQAIAIQYNVRNIPTLLLIKDGQVVQQMVGLQQEAKLQQLIENA
ncbi:MAG: thioredoxin [Lentisphaerae bacterium]|nr:thioredoxin [Lentisphaerota bacterium]